MVMLGPGILALNCSSMVSVGAMPMVRKFCESRSTVVPENIDSGACLNLIATSVRLWPSALPVRR